MSIVSWSGVEAHPWVVTIALLASAQEFRWDGAYLFNVHPLYWEKITLQLWVQKSTI